MRYTKHTPIKPNSPLTIGNFKIDKYLIMLETFAVDNLHSASDKIYFQLLLELMQLRKLNEPIPVLLLNLNIPKNVVVPEIWVLPKIYLN